MPPNIEAFNAVTLELLSILYRLHPLKASFSESDLTPETRALISSLSATALPPFHWHAALWLEKEGYIRIGSKTLNGGLSFIELTGKGFAALSEVPHSLSGKEPLGDRMVKTLGSAAGEARTAAIGELVGAAFGAAIRALS